MKRRGIFIAVLILVILNTLAPVFTVNAQGTPEEEARALLARLTPEERIGQLFLVTFQGAVINPDSAIYDLIARHHIGGVVLSKVNDNFTEAPATISDAIKLVTSLQEVEWNSSSSNTTIESTPIPASPDVYIPLFVGIEQPGDGLAYDQILSGLSIGAPEMAIGATWDPEAARQSGFVMGSELSTMGINLYLGPSLDVVTAPSTEEGDPGTLVFGGDPFWVGKLGQAYIEGLHTGSNKRLAVISQNFPGRGEADRPPDEEVSTVRKSLEQLKQIELAPYFAVTGNAPSPLMTTDGLLVSHIRYQGFQGNIRATTRPVSFDSQALGQILGLEPFATWRNEGGIVVSDDLGSPAVSRFYDPTGNNFSAMIVARDAFVAGNDLLYMGNIESTGDADSYEIDTKNT